MWLVKIIGYALAAMYPVLIFFAVCVFHFPLRLISLMLLVFAASVLLIRREKISAAPFVMGLIAVFVIITNSEAVLKFYPVIINLLFLCTFALSLRERGGIIYTFAQLGDKTIKWNAHQGGIQDYCRKVTYVWCMFFVFNAAAACYTVFLQETSVWALYNGLVSYLLMGCLFAAEFICRIKMQKKLSKMISLSAMTAESRNADDIICYAGTFSDGNYKRWKDYLRETAAVREFINRKAVDKIILHSDDFWYFIVALTAALQCKKEVYVSSNYSYEFIKTLIDEKTLCLFDTDSEYAASISSVIAETQPVHDTALPPVARDAHVYLFTSGSTGEPKGVLHEINELEDDNDSIGERWRGDFQKRILVSSVNPHHAFGIVFAAIKPFLYGVPFRRERITQPDDFLYLGSEKYIFITTPSFLKMSTKDPSLTEAVKTVRDIAIVTAGGVLYRNEAQSVCDCYGSFPLEIYGSTETGAVGWRINRDDESEWWTPTHGVRTELGDDGCLIFYCGAIHGGVFHSSDLAQLRDDGKFKLLGRKDSIVKIAEKRVSLIEVQNRIRQTGLAEDAAVFALASEKRQYLAAVVVLSCEGRSILENKKHAERVKLFRSQLGGFLEPVTIPRRWRFVSELPYNGVGKLQKQEMVALFDKEIEE